MLLKLIENYKNKRELTDSIEEAMPVKFEVPHPIVIDEINKYVDSLDISDDDVFCFCTTYVSIVPMIYFALKLKTINKNVKTIFGGYHVTLSKHTRDLILRLGIGDVVVMNDGSGVILDIVEGNRQGLVDGPYIKNARLPDYDAEKVNACEGWVSTITSF